MDEVKDKLLTAQHILKNNLTKKVILDNLENYLNYDEVKDSIDSYLEKFELIREEFNDEEGHKFLDSLMNHLNHFIQNTKDATKINLYHMELLNDMNYFIENRFGKNIYSSTDKVRIQEIATEAGASNAVLIEKAKELGYDVKAANSMITVEQAGILVDYAINGVKPKVISKSNGKVMKLESENKNIPKMVWVISPGENAEIWDECKEGGYIAIGWDKIDVNQYSQKSRLKQDLVEKYDLKNNTRKDTFLWNFANKINIDDIIIARKGRKKIVGIGRVISNYISPSDAINPRKDKEYRQIRKISWLYLSEYELYRMLAIGTVSKISSNDPRVSELLNTVFKENKKSRKDVVKSEAQNKSIDVFKNNLNIDNTPIYNESEIKTSVSKLKNETRIIKYIEKKYNDYIDEQGYDDLKQMLFLYEDIELQQQREIFAYFHEYINSLLEIENSNTTGYNNNFEEKLFGIFQNIKSFQKNLLNSEYSFLMIPEYQKFVDGDREEYHKLNIIEVEPIFQLLNSIKIISKVEKELFDKLIEKLVKKDRELGLAFQLNIEFQSYENNILTWVSNAKGEDKEILTDNFSLIKSFTQDIFGFETKIKRIEADSLNSQEEREKIIPMKNDTEAMKEESREKFSNDKIGDVEFNYKNILLKGVPGTGKSRTIDNIIKKELKLENHYKTNVLRINIHSASSNADLMQGIAINSNSDGSIGYKEKKGLVLEFIEKATFCPKQPFVLVLEEIQENSLNELIGDLIYLIDNDKRAEKLKPDNIDYSYIELIKKIISDDTNVERVEMPNLISQSIEIREMVIPENLFIFCTSNYRDDRKVIEDNLLRRFDVIEIYPKYKEEIGDDFKSDEASKFLKDLNEKIVTVCSNNGEIHPDRFMIGHSIWLKVKDREGFSRAFLKVITEFKDVKDMYFNDFNEIVKDLTFPFDMENKYDSYELWIKALQEECYTFLKS